MPLSKISKGAVKLLRDREQKLDEKFAERDAMLKRHKQELLKLDIAITLLRGEASTALSLIQED